MSVQMSNSPFDPEQTTAPLCLLLFQIAETFSSATLIDYSCQHFTAVFPPLHLTVISKLPLIFFFFLVLAQVLHFQDLKTLFESI